MAQEAGGRFLLRIEDIDEARCRPEFEAAIHEDLAWLGLAWEQPVRRQSDQFADYAAALARLEAAGVVYPCFCTRKDIRREVAAMASAPQGPDGPLYPGTCRDLDAAQRADQVAAGRAFALRLDARRAAAITGPLAWHDTGAGDRAVHPGLMGDVLLARKDAPASYHLAVVVDDHLQGVTLVTRGEDLLSATHVHRMLQALLGFDAPAYHHHRLLTDAHGQRLAKRTDALAIRALREAGESPEDVLRRVGMAA